MGSICNGARELRAAGGAQFNSKCAGDVARLYSSESVEEICGYATDEIIPRIPVRPPPSPTFPPTARPTVCPLPPPPPLPYCPAGG